MAPALSTLVLALAATGAPQAHGGSQTEHQFVYGPHSVRPAMHYFRQWADDEVDQKISRDPELAYGSLRQADSPWSGEQYAALMHQHRTSVCDVPDEIPVTLMLHSSEVDVRGVHHALFHSSESGHFQYVALKKGRVLVMDPPPCARRPMRPSLLSQLMQRRLEGEAAKDTEAEQEEPVAEEPDSEEPDAEKAEPDAKQAKLDAKKAEPDAKQAKLDAKKAEMAKKAEPDAEKAEMAKKAEPEAEEPADDKAETKKTEATADSEELEDPIEVGKPDSVEGEQDELLHPEHDALVHDCVELFERTTEEDCHQKVNIEVLSASLEMIDGLEVRMHLKVQKEDEPEEAAKSGKGGAKSGKGGGEGGGKPAPFLHHRVYCAFEPRRPGEHPEAEPEDVETPEEKKGLVATIIMRMDICKALSEENQSPEDRRLLEDFDKHRMGELSLVKGYRHVYDGIPRYFDEIMSKEAVAPKDLPKDFSLRTSHPECFPDGGTSVVRNQGSCGSCWAFASASSIMANICVAGAGNHSFSKTYGDRYEVSIQRIISCNKYKYGCHGGHAMAASDAFENALMAVERTLPYQCGGGDSLKHFEEESGGCEEYPWGGSDATCSDDVKKESWHFQKMFIVNGEKEMQEALVAGYAMYVSFKVYQNVFYIKDEIFEKPEGSAVGGHAVSMIGYGVDAGKKYWWIQNSWGPNWADKGYFRFLRGENLAGIEESGIYFRAYPDGGSPPPLPPQGPVAEAQRMAKKIMDRMEDDPDFKMTVIGAAAGVVVLFLSCCILLCCCCCCGKKEYKQLDEPKTTE